MGRPAHFLCRLWQAGAVASRERHEDVLGSWRRDGCGAHVGCSVHIPPLAVAGGGGRVQFKNELAWLGISIDCILVCESAARLRSS